MSLMDCQENWSRGKNRILHTHLFQDRHNTNILCKCRNPTQQSMWLGLVQKLYAHVPRFLWLVCAYPYGLCLQLSWRMLKSSPCGRAYGKVLFAVLYIKFIGIPCARPHDFFKEFPRETTISCQKTVLCC